MASVTMSVIACSSNDSVLEPAPSDEEVQGAIFLINDLKLMEDNSSSMITSSDSVTSEAKQLELINAQPQSNIVQLNHDLRPAIALLNRPSPVKDMVVGAVKDKTLWDAFTNCESVVQFKTDLSNKNPVFSQALVGNVQADGNQGSAVDKNRYFKLIIDKAREMVLEVVSKAFDGMEKVFLDHEQQSHQKSKQSCFDSKYQEGSSTFEKIFDMAEHIMRTPFLATLLVNVMVLLCRLIREMLRYRSLT